MQMEFGLDKCKIQTMINDKHSTNAFELQDSGRIGRMEEIYKYLGVYIS